MRINIYYGGRGFLEDSTLFVMNKIEEVLKELRVEVVRYHLSEEKGNINTLPQTLKEADAVILATTVEWLGIGGYMQQFLDACWLYADKERIQSLYMMPVVLSTTYGERDAEYFLIKAWEMLGGKTIQGICAYVQNHIEFETNSEYIKQIEKRTEDLYRGVNQKQRVFPNSQGVLKHNTLRMVSMELTPQESEQLSMYATDDTYMKKQKEDIQELTMLFKEMLGETEKTDILYSIQKAYHPKQEVTATFAIELTDSNKTMLIKVSPTGCECSYGEKSDGDVIAKTTTEVLEKIINNTTNFQKAFMTGEIVAKGDFKTLRSFDELFDF